MMIIPLGGLHIGLESDDAVINDAWRLLFDGWPLLQEGAVDIRLKLSLADSVTVPNGRLTFTDPLNIISTYADDGDDIHLHYHDGARISLSLHTESSRADGVLTMAVITNGRFEDITYTSLAPLLRRRGLFLVHAFAAAKNGEALLISAASNQGKTTTGLSLILDGWQLLSNDAVLLQKRDDAVYALPAPGHVGIRQPSLTLLPALGRWVEGVTAVNNAYTLTGGMITNGRWAAPAPITAIAYPCITNQPASQKIPQNSAISLAALMAESIDCWDPPLLVTHMSLLRQLSQQADTYALHLGRDVAALPALLAN